MKYSFGGFEFDMERNLLLKQGSPIAIGQRGLALLSCLLAAKGRPVTKAELMDAAWPSEHVEESNLTVQISALRKALGRAPNGDDWIATVQRSGYQFVNPVADTKPPPAVMTLAVLPFENLSTDPEQAFFADGLTEDLITDLSRVPGLQLTSKHSSFAFRNRGEDKGAVSSLLGVRYLVDGSVRRAQGRVRVSAQLIDTEDNTTVWADRYDRDLQDIFDLQEDVARSIASAIKGVVAAPSYKRYRASSLDAYDLVVASRNLPDKSLPANREAFQNLQRALRLDPNYPAVHNLLGITELLWWLLWDGDSIVARRNALLYAERAVKLAPDEAEVYELQGFVLIKHNRFQEALTAYEKALKIDPNFANVHAGMADWHFAMGHRAKALASAQMAISLEAFPPGWYYEHLGRIELFNGFVEQAIATLQRPETYGMFSGRSLAAALAAAGRMEEAREESRLFMLRQPHWRISDWIATEFFAHKDDADFWFNAYKLAGLPE
jgi:TolB-like protein